MYWILLSTFIIFMWAYSSSLYTKFSWPKQRKTLIAVFARKEALRLISRRLEEIIEKPAIVISKVFFLRPIHAGCEFFSSRINRFCVAITISRRCWSSGTFSMQILNQPFLKAMSCKTVSADKFSGFVQNNFLRGLIASIPWNNFASTSHPIPPAQRWARRVGSARPLQRLGGLDLVEACQCWLGG